MADQSEPAPFAGQFRAVMAFLEHHGYIVAKGYGGDVAYHGGHTQDRLAGLYAEECREVAFDEGER